ncbi:MAG: hypothetical protein JSS39_17585 [Nitrospira sp.]|nr:hypothetical protein [Nitrospira sp.]
MTESVVEPATLVLLEALGCQLLHGPDIAADETGAERSDLTYCDVLLDAHLREPMPKLISGELLVRDVERFVERAV